MDHQLPPFCVCMCVLPSFVRPPSIYSGVLLGSGVAGTGGFSGGEEEVRLSPDQRSGALEGDVLNERGNQKGRARGGVCVNFSSLHRLLAFA